MKKLRSIASAGLLVSLLVIAWVAMRQPKPVLLIPTLTGEPEYCQSCHANLPEISLSHPIESFGCVLCHGGQALALDADLAHSTLRGGDNPSRLDVVEESCGGADCHSGQPFEHRDHIQRVRTSIQATYAGAIANMRYTFGAQADLQARQAVFATTDPDGRSATGILSLAAFDPSSETNPSVITFAENCLYCHLAAEPLADLEYQRLTGCAACHTPFSSQDTGQIEQHTLTAAIPYTQCNTCHNRGNYDLRAMQFIQRTDHPADRMNDYYQPIAQFVRCEWTLDCIDCHTRQEAMGDGDLYSSQAEMQYVQCKTCHGTLSELPKQYTLSSRDTLAESLAFLNPNIDLQPGDTVLVTEKGELMWNIRPLEDGRYELTGKATGQRFIYRPVMGTACQQNIQQQESRYCHVCHSVDR